MKPPPGDWVVRGACKLTGAKPNTFFPDRGETVIPAKKVCADCEVRAECLAYAMTTPQERGGIWGGLSGRERRKLGGFTLGDYLPAVKLADDPGARVKAPKPEPIHGTTAGYAYHWRNGEVVCDECAEAKRAYDRQRNRSRSRRRYTADAITETRAAIGPRRETGRILEVVR